MKNLLLVTSILILVFAVLGESFDYGFFTLVRLTVSGTTTYLAWRAHEANQRRWIWAFGTIAVIFNPLLPLALGRDIWVLADLLTIVALTASIFRFKDSKTD